MPKAAKKKVISRKSTARRRVGVDPIGASKDGHQFHEAWLARRSLGLLLSLDGLCGIAVEGLSLDVEEDAPQEAIEIADATFFYGERATFAKASRIEVTQFKYSVARSATPMRFSDARKTLEKFSIAEAAFVAKHGTTQTHAKFRYVLFTNRAVSTDLAEAITAARVGSSPTAKGPKEQYEQLRSAVALKGKGLTEFLRRVDIVGGSDNLASVEKGNERIIADWSASTDMMARARIGDLRKIVRDKAGADGQHNKLITKVDVLAALGLAHEDDLLPTPDAFPEIGQVVRRAQLTAFLKVLGGSGRWLIQAEGGIGKTVFVQSVARQLGSTDEVVLFDCFGGGAYRSPIDERHRPERGLMHIVNELACRGLCDPILPGSSEPSEVIRRSIERFEQALVALRRTRPDARLVIIMDAADNAADEAQKRNQPSFPKELLESLTHRPPSDGLIVIATARPERHDLAIGSAECSPYRIEPFTLEETTAFVSARRPEATVPQIAALRSRSDGNPRVLANLIEPDRSLAGETLSTEKVQLDSLIEDRIERAIKLADAKGAKAGAIDSFLCALGMLPPPVPVDEMAIAFGLSKEEASSLAADLSPLLERTKYGLIFRDEPTETLVKRKYGSRLNLMNDVVVRLRDAQGTSVYAARALPLLLFAMGRVDDLRQLAFDTRFPPELDSEVPKRAIRLVRVKMALGAAARARDFNTTTDLLVELSSLALVNERGDQYLANNPDLVVGLADPESLRRLFEMNLGWPGERHARLAVAYTMDRDLGAAYGHAVRADEWIRWTYQQDDTTIRSHSADEDVHVAIPFYLTVEGRQSNAAGYIGAFDPNFGYQLADRLFSLLSMAKTLGKFPELSETFTRLARCKKAPPALLSAALSYIPADSDDDAGRILKHLATQQKKPIGSRAYVPRDEDSFRASLLRCALRACALNLNSEAKALLQQASPRRYDFWSLSDPWPTSYVLPWVLAVAVEAALAGRKLTLFDCLPDQLWRLVEGTTVPQELKDQQKAVEEALKADPPAEERAAKREGASPSRSQLSSSDRQRVSDAFKERILPALELGNCVVQLLKAETPKGRKAKVLTLFRAWQSARESVKASMWGREGASRYVDALYSACALHLLPGVVAVDPEIAELLEQCVNRSEFIYSPTRIQIVTLLSSRSECHAYAGRAATAALKLILLEDDAPQRADLFARLSRAILPANRTEANLLFKRGLTELEAIGSGDHDFMNELLAFATSIRGGTVNPTTALRLAKICELNNYDSHKFPWVLSARAFSRIWGTKYLAQIARWQDRDKVDLELTLPAAISFLVRDQALPPTDGVLLLGLVEPVGMWDWGWRDLFETLIMTTGEVSLFEDLLDQFERAFPAGSSGRCLPEIREALQKNPTVHEKMVARLDTLQAEESARRKMDHNSRPPSIGPVDASERVRRKEIGEANVEAAIAAANPLDPASLETFVETINEFEGALDMKVAAFRKLWSRISYGDREKHIEAVVATRNLELFAKSELLKAAKESWEADSPSALAVVNKLAKRLVSAHAKQLMSADWGFNWELNKLAELTGLSRTDLAIDLVVEATSRNLKSAAPTWLNLACLTSPSADATVPRRAFERLLDDATGRLADEVGDGAWRPELDPGNEPEEVVAGLIWFCLGAPEAKARWRAAHVVRSCARRGRWSLLAKLFDKLGSPDAGAFKDQTLPFFSLHSKFWFLLAVARISLDYPTEIAKFVGAVETIALEESFPHVGLKDLAVKILNACLGKEKGSEAKAILKRVASVNVSRFPQPATKEPVSDQLWNRPKDVPREEPRFQFEYDFEKYEITGLGRLFGVPQWEAGDRCIKWIRKLSPDAKSMYDYAGRRKPSEDYRDGTKDRLHSFGTYLAWHALALTAGELLLERPLARLESYEESLNEWLSKYRITRADGLWLSDGTGCYPACARDELLDEGTSKERRPTCDHNTLLRLAGIGESRTLDADFLATGNWQSPDGIRVDISTALVPAREADRAAVALGLSTEFHMYLPTATAFENQDDDHRSREHAPCKEWVSRREGYVKLDEFDPYGSRAAIQRDRLTMAINKKYSLSSHDPWSAIWSRPGGKVAYTAEAWGMRQGEGRSERGDEGTTVTCQTHLLLEVLRKSDCYLLMLVKLELFIERNRFDLDGEDSKFVHGWVSAVIDEKGRVRVVEPTAADRKAISVLSEYDVHSFNKRFEALAKAQGR